MTVLTELFVGEGVEQSLAVAVAAVFVFSSTAVLVARLLQDNVALRSGVLVAALLACLLVPIVGGYAEFTRWSVVSIPVSLDATTVYSQEYSAEPAEHVVAQSELADIPAYAASTSEPASTMTQPVSINEPIVWAQFVFKGLLAVWAIGTFCCIAFTVRGYWRMRRILGASTPVDIEPIRPCINQALRHFRLNKTPRILCSDQIAGPAVYGVLRPVLLLPPQFARQLSSTQLTDVLIHEFAHIQRHDTRILLLETVARCLYWPVISVHWMLRALENAREEICDNYAVNQRGNIAYVETLLNLAELGTSRAIDRSPAVGIMNWQGKLERRVAAILDPRRDSSLRLKPWLFTLLVGLGLSISVLVSGARLVADEGDEPATTEKVTPIGPVSGSLPPTEEDFKKAGTREITVRGTAKDFDGKAVANARVVLIGSSWTDRVVAETKTDESGKYAFEKIAFPVKSNQASVFAIADGYGITWHGAMSLMEADQQAKMPEHILKRSFDPDKHAQMDLVFPKPASLIGIIHDGDGTPIKNAKVVVRQLDYLDPTGKTDHINYREFNGLHLTPKKYRESTTDEHGKFQLSGLPFQTYAQLWVDHDDYATKILFAAITDKRMKEFERPSGSFFTIVGGKQVAKIRFQTTAVSTNPVRVRLHETQRVAVRAVDEAGKPLSDMRVNLDSNVGGARVSAYGKTNKEGIANLKAPPGKHSLSVRPPRTTDRVPAKQTIAVVKGKNLKIDIHVKLGGVFLARAVDAKTGVPIPGIGFSLKENGKTSGLNSVPHYVDHPKTDEKGELRVLLPAGTHVIGTGFHVLPNNYRDTGKARHVIIKSGEVTKVTFKLEN